MSTKKTTPRVMTKKLCYELRVIVSVPLDDPEEITDIIERNRELGSCEVVNCEVIEVPYE